MKTWQLLSKSGGGYSVGYDDGYSDGYSTAHGKMKVSQIVAYGPGDSYSETVDTGGTAEKNSLLLSSWV